MKGLSTLKRGQLAMVVMLATSGLTLGMTGVSQGSGVTVSDLSNGATPTGMAESLAGGGVSISNVKYTGENRAAGTFTTGASSIGFENGIVLDSGKAQTYSTDAPCSRGVEGPNTCYEETEGKPQGPGGEANSTGFGTPGDTQLSELSGGSTHDASVLEFDFVPQHSTVQFSYVFGSEEYSDFVYSFNDIFAFFVNGTNCALVPGTSEPVAVDTINNGNDTGGSTTPAHPEFFRDNVRPSPSIESQMDGLTTVLSCTATVKEGETNHIKLAVADALDTALDSAVFIQAGSLVSGTQIKTSLSGEGKSGETITVKEGTAVTDNATLSGANAPKATGKVTYKVYSDSDCSKEVTSAGEVEVTAGSVPASSAETLAPGTYYWQASYSGDAKNNGSTNECGSEVETVEGTRPPTQLSTSLSGEGKTGESITVKQGAAVTDQASLSGKNASKATGKVSYKVYSDNACSKLVTEAGEVEVTAGTVPPSNPETLATGTYYWQASYSGDAENEASKSTCGSEVETVEGEPCSSVTGYAKVLIRKEGETEHQSVTNKLSTNLASKQKLVFLWENGASKLNLTKLTSASCTVSVLKKKTFTGKGEATVNGEPGWHVQFYFTLTAKNNFTFHILASKPKEAPFAFTIKAAGLITEKFA